MKVIGTIAIGVLGALIFLGFLCNRRRKNDALAIAQEYADQVDISKADALNISQWQKQLCVQSDIKKVYDQYIQDKRLHGSNEHFYGTVFGVALEHRLEKKIAGKSSLEIAQNIVAREKSKFGVIPRHKFGEPKQELPWEKWLGTVYPKVVVDAYTEELWRQPIQFPWYDKNNPDVIYVDPFMVAWHDGEMI